MKLQVNYTYEELIRVINEEKSDKVVSRDSFIEFCENLRVTLSQSKDARDTQRTALNLFKAFSESSRQIRFCNQTLIEFYRWYKEHASAELLKHGHNRCTATVRAFMLKREPNLLLLPLYTLKKALKLSSYSKLTQSCIIYYEKNGRYVTSEVMHIQKLDGGIQVKKRFKRTERLLAPRSIYNRLERFTSLIDKLKLKCIKEITAKVIEDYLVENLYANKVRKMYLEVESFFGNLEDARMIKESPFSTVEYEKPRSNINNDMLHPDDIKKLQEMALGLEGLSIIQARTLTFLMLCYDTAMRLNEALYVDIGDFMNDEVNMTLKLAGDKQKGQKKISRFLLLYFPETRYVLKKYIEKIRPQFTPKSEALFLSTRGTRLNEQMINKDIHALMGELKIKTFNGKRVTSHIMRHSFASHNIEPLGLKLSLDQVIARLRHQDRSLAEKVYILDNPFIEMMKHQERQQSLSLSNSTNRFWMVEKVTFMGWMKNELKLPKRFLSQLEEYYDDRLNVRENKTERVENLPVMVEDEVLKLLSKFNLTVTALRKYCLENSYCRKFGKEFKYDEDFIWMLRDEYISKDEVLNKLKITRVTLFRQRKLLGLITIGRVVIACKGGLIAYLEKQNGSKL